MARWIEKRIKGRYKGCPKGITNSVLPSEWLNELEMREDVLHVIAIPINSTDFVDVIDTLILVRLADEEEEESNVNYYTLNTINSIN